MKYYVRWEVLDSLVEEDIAHTKGEFQRQIEKIEKSGKMTDGGVLLGIRGGYFIVEIDKPAELLHLLGPAIWDNCHVETYPVLTYGELGVYLKTEYKKAA